MAKFDSILGTIGHTPVVKINKLAPNGVNLYVKIEAFNPLGSVKDRLALGVIEDAETSWSAESRKNRDRAEHQWQYRHRARHGLCGKGLSACRHHGRKLLSVERRKLMRFLGAEVVLTPASARACLRHGRTRPRSSRRSTGWYFTRQFENEANADFHSSHDGARDHRGLQGTIKLDYWVTGYGTGGTLKGVSRVFAQGNPAQIPRSLSASRRTRRCSFGGEGQQRNADGTPASGPRVMEAASVAGIWAPDFIPQADGRSSGEAVRSTKSFRVAGPDALRCSRSSWPS